MIDARVTRQNHKLGSDWLFITIIVFLSIIIYANTLWNGFVYDDMGEIVNNQWVRQFNNLFSACHRYRISETFTIWLDYKLWDHSAVGYHFTSLLFHILVSVGVYFLANLILKNRLSAFFTGALFATHPVHTEAVSVISHRQELLAMLFMLISLILYIKGRSFDKTKRKKTWFFIILSLISYFFAMTAKEVAIILPVLIFLYDCFFHSNSSIRNWKLEIRNSAKYYIPYLVIFGLFFLFSITGPRWRFSYAGFNVVSLGHSLSGGRSYASILLTQLKGFSEYLRLLFYPNRLSIDYYFPIRATLFQPSTILGLILLFGLLALMIILFKKSKIISFGMAWFFINLLPVANIIPKTFFVAERYLYIPSFGFCLIVGFTLWQLVIRKSLKIWGIILFGLIISFYSVRTIMRNFDFKSEYTLWSKTLKDNPMSSTGYNNLGAALLDSGEIERSIEQFRKAIELVPTYAKSYYNLGIAFLNIERYDEAIDNLSSSIRYDPKSYESYIALGTVYQKLGKHSEAIEEFKIALTINEDANIHHALGISFQNVNRFDDARQEFERAIAINPDLGEAHNDLGIEYGRKGLFDEAIQEFNIAIMKMANPVPAYHNLGLIYQKKGELEPAIEAFQKAKDLSK
ncbi:MAG: tetratricopeptide repeat protein [Candidatus Bathyarchaeota archaeon]|nr:tetratricopeptide repeat protein [Candidatus Bathyarchaeota archaeon]